MFIWYYINTWRSHSCNSQRWNWNHASWTRERFIHRDHL